MFFHKALVFVCVDSDFGCSFTRLRMCIENYADKVTKKMLKLQISLDFFAFFDEISPFSKGKTVQRRGFAVRVAVPA